MNTKHTRVVVTLFLAVATLTTVGFSASHNNTLAASIMPDVGTCELGLVWYPALEMLASVVEPCQADPVARAATENDWSYDSSPAIDMLLVSAPVHSPFTSVWPADQVDRAETESVWSYDSSPAIDMLLVSAPVHSSFTSVWPLDPIE